MIQNQVIVANITWNKYNWKKIYVDPRAGHRYAKKFPGHESLNFKFDKEGLDDEKQVYGYVQCRGAPSLSDNAIIIFYTKNLDRNKGEIVGVYGDAKVLKKEIKTKWKGFEDDEIVSNIVGMKDLSLLFPIPLDSDKYSKGERLVPQAGFAYKNKGLAEQILLDEIKETKNIGKLVEYEKLKNLYKFLTREEYDEDIREQEELIPIIKKTQNKKQIIKNLQEISPKTSEVVEYKGKQYKRDNKTIAQLKIIKDFKCQICGEFILKKDGSRYVEAAHITEKRYKGAETPENILLLCPNHHKEFDLGDRIIIKRTKENIIFNLNGKRYEISLKIV